LSIHGELGKNPTPFTKLCLFGRAKNQLQLLRITDAIFFGDSRLLIIALVTSSKPKKMKFIHLIKKIKGISTSFHKLDFYHISKNLNQETDKATNIVA